MALSRSASLSEDPSSRDWRMAASFSCAGPTAGRFRPAREAEPDEAYVEGMEPAPPLGFLPVMDLLVGLVAEAVGLVWTWGLGWVTIRGRFGRLWI